MSIDHTLPDRPVGGRRSPRPRPKGLLQLTDFVDVAFLAHSASVDWTVGVDFGLYENDKFGDCGPTYVANSRRLTTKWLTGTEVRPTQDDVFDLYRRSGNPQFDPATGADDNGVDMTVMLDAVCSGGIGGVKAIAYAALDPKNMDQLQAAIEIFHGVGFGVTLQVAQQTQVGTWNYIPGSGTWGGHAILGAAFTPTDVDVISWDELFKMTPSFIQHDDDEAYVVIWPEHLADPRVDKVKLAAAYKALTGRDLPIPVAPTPPGPVAPFPGVLVAAVAALAGDPQTAAFLGERHWRAADKAVATRLKTLLAAPRA